MVVSVGDGYLIRLPEDGLDLTVFEQRVARARTLRAAGELTAAAELLRAALDGWQGAALAGLPGPLAASEGSRLGEERLATLETWLDIEVERGRHDKVVAELIALTGKYPLREQLCRLLMLALYRSGRQAEALAAYRATRRTLVAELGIEPGAPLRNLHDRILAADATLDACPPGRPVPASPVSPASPPPLRRRLPSVVHTARPAQLPADLAAFAGRSAELDRARALLSERDDPRPAC